MADADNEYRIKIVVDPTAATPGLEKTVAGITSLETAAAKTAAAMEAMPGGALMSLEEYQASLAATAQTADASAASTGRAAEVAREYGISLTEAVRALALLGEAQASAAIDSAELDAAVESAVRSTTAGTTATAQRTLAQRALVEAEMAAIAAEDDLAASGSALAGIAEALAAALKRQGIAQAEVAATAQRANSSYEAAAVAMIRIKNAELAKEVARVTAVLDEASAATDANTAATEANAAANDLDADAMAKRAIMMRRTSDGLVDIALGGRRAIQGVTDLQYVMTGLFPEGTATIAVIAGIALIGEVWERMSHKMAEDHHTATGKVKSDIDGLGDAWSPAAAAMTGYVDGLKSILAVQKDIADQAQRAIDLAKEQGTLRETDAKQETTQRLQSLRAQYIQDQAGNHTDDERKLMKARYDDAKKNIEDGGAVISAFNEELEIRVQIDAAKRKLDDMKAAERANEVAVAQAANAADEVRKNRTDPRGITLNKEGTGLIQNDPDGKASDPIARKLAEIDNTASQLDLLKKIGMSTYSAMIVPGLGWYDMANAKNQVPITEARLRQERADRDQMQADLATLQKEKDINKEIAPKLPEQQATIGKLQDQINDLRAQLPQKQTAESIAVTNQSEDAGQSKLDIDAEQNAENYRRFVQGNEDDARRKKSDRSLDKKASTQAYDSERAADRAAVTAARDALNTAEGSQRDTKDSMQGLGTTAVRHATVTAQLASTTKAALDAYRDRLQQAEEKLHELESAHAQGQANAQAQQMSNQTNAQY